jgi:hypothetical protein
VLAKGVLNHSSNDFWELKTLGRTKFRRAQSSGRLFCTNQASVLAESEDKASFFTDLKGSTGQNQAVPTVVVLSKSDGEF